MKKQENRQENMPIPTNPVVYAAMGAIWAGGPKWEQKGIWEIKPEENTAQVRYSSPSGGQIQVWVDPRVESEMAVWTMEQLENYLSTLTDFTADVALSVLAALAEARSPLLQPVIVDADKIIRQKGMQAWGENKKAIRQIIEREMENLQHLRFEVHQLPAIDPETGRWNSRGFNWQGDRLFDIVRIEKYDLNNVAIMWSVRAGQWAYYFLSPSARRWVCNFAGALLKLSHRQDRKVEVLAKRIGYYVMLNKWRLAKGQPLRWSIGTLCNAIRENPLEDAHPGRFREAFESALELLVEKKVFERVVYPQEYWQDVNRSKGWVTRWLKYEITIILPSESEEIESQEKTAFPTAKALPPAKTSKRKGETKIDGNEIRKIRQERNWRQEELARYLGISRRYLSNIENGKSQPGAAIAKKILQWLKEQPGK
ncbi:MAG: helix-turn-helix domain-containing protein [Thermanaeromonas sp.]|uniref:helix-turn-helix transcriptional regulator n=1 Tax=Thermanaeromonas sp. TaxID=2003697 RepID=UPI00243B2000|nr:helix-turn-helix transcriptional regulator [Thermanaeromonas sp.]MCG0277941.1 helix-turn-helix domain-containing protein [Thermanaeromonas sp.]